jgi:Cu+-exporting ATPase
MNTRQTSFAIQGMFCANCAVTIERTLTRLDGVIAVNVNYATERAMVMFNPSRVSAAQMVQAVRREGFQVSQQHIGLNVDGLMYTSSARTIARVLERVDGVVHVSVDLQAQHIELDVIAEQENYSEYERAIANLGLRVVEQLAPDSTREFAVRLFFIIALTLLSLWSAGAHAKLFDAGFIHAPLVVMSAAVVIAYGVGWRFYRLAFDSALRGTFDASVMIALVASASLFLGLLVALLAPTRGFTSVGFIVTILLTAGWFSARAVTILAHAPAWLHQLAPQAALGLIAEPRDENAQAKNVFRESPRICANEKKISED